MRLEQAFFNSSRGPQHREFQKEILQAMQVGVGPNTEVDGKSAYINVQVGVGPQHREFQKEILQAMQVGVGPQHREFQKEILQIFNYTLAVADV
ncbi:hypothetical protein [Staphylococcus argenteus]|nr:hypothetical protein [Staphylococcus argenteus]MBE2134994.1 hypothetical protein [Staphylococcus argenteus]MBE2161034.1 hypothetical protein [Staphylococcus argenteus]MCG9798976.1 hypothetical protein [Staphylococcus argenteus]MCG9821954.1 hypothetical protein [Staphylococcus argenteus]MCG9829624.1 hypothetical protein [Staphylococcus argenteus]